MSARALELIKQNILSDFDLENARLDLEIAELQQKKARNLYEKALYSATNSLPERVLNDKPTKIRAI